MFYDRVLSHLFILAITISGLGLLHVQAREEISGARVELAVLLEESPGVLLQLAGAGLVLAGVGARCCQLVTRDEG